MKYHSTLLVCLFITASSMAQTQKKMENQNTPITGKTVRWTWSKGAFAGGTYDCTFYENGNVRWKGIAGAEKDKEQLEKEYTIMQVGKDLYMLSWLESVGYTVTATLDLKEKRIFGVVSNASEWYPLSGVIESIK